MPRLTSLLGLTVRAPDGRLRRVRDLAVDLAQPYPRVTRRVFERDAPAGPGELLLARHLLDTQVFDVEGKRLWRVGDVELAGEGDDLRVAAVDVGPEPVLRRLGRRPARAAHARRHDVRRARGRRRQPRPDRRDALRERSGRGDRSLRAREQDALDAPLGVEAALDDRVRAAPIFYGTFGVVTGVGAANVLVPGAPLVPILFLTQALNAVLLLPILVAIYGIVRDRQLMGEHTLTPLGAAAALGAIGLITVCVAALAVVSLV